MRVVVNEQKVSRNRRIAQYAFFLTLGLLVAGLFVTNAAPTNPALYFAPLIVLPIAIAATLYSVRMANLWLREPRPEVILKNGLKGLSSRSVIYHYWLPANHVLISPEGVFTFTLRPQDGHFTVEGERWLKKGNFLNKFATFFRQDMIGRPDVEAAYDAEKLQQLIDTAIPDSGVTVEPIILLSGAAVEFEAEDTKYPILYAEPKKKPNLKSFIKEVKQRDDNMTLTEEQIELLEKAAEIQAE